MFILILVFIHLLLIHSHSTSSSNPLILVSKPTIRFTSYLIFKDFYSFTLLIFVLLLIFYCVNFTILLESLNFSIANNLVAPAEIVPE